MRQERTVQATIFEVFAGHQIGCELRAISDWLDGQRALLSLVASVLRRKGRRPTGRRGLPAETVLRCALLKQQRQLSYEELAFHLEDSASFSRLCPAAAGMVAKGIGAASNRQRDSPRDL
jgi:IS5 family transposase